MKIVMITSFKKKALWLTKKTREGISIETCHKSGQDAQEKKMTR